jgi:purine-binding chemotaxis protein CheW
MESVVIFEVAAQRFGLPLERVERAVRIVEITPLPRAPAVVAGVIDVRGSVIPVIDVRQRFRLPQRASLLTDQLLVVDTAARRLALWVDTVSGVVDYRAQDFVAAEAVVPGMEYLRGIARLADGLVLIQDLEQLLSLAEERALAEAILDV